MQHQATYQEENGTIRDLLLSVKINNQKLITSVEQGIGK